MISTRKVERPLKAAAFALPIVIWLLVLVAVTVVTMLFLLRQDRAISHNYGEQIRAREFARAGVETFLLDVRHEMKAGSTMSTDKKVWSPRSGISMRLKSIPARDLSDPKNYLRSSVAFDPAAIFPEPDYKVENDDTALPPSRAGTALTTSASRNGRRIDPSFWDQPHLATAGALDAKTPAWILIKRGGVDSSGSAWDDKFKDRGSANRDYVLGRYAYQVYDVGGLLDINATGHPDGLSAEQRRDLEGTPQSIDLTQLGGLAEHVAELIAFRNAQTASSTSSYVDAAINPLTATGGNMNTVQGDNRFLSRGDLIRFAHNKNIPNDDLEFLTHFSRDLNAPAWKPTNPENSTIDYEAVVDTIGANRFLANVRSSGGSISYYTIDGTLKSRTLENGDPLVWRRFPLARLRWLNSVMAGGDTKYVPAVRMHFGLNWDATRKRWVYNPDGGLTPASTVLKLDQISGREPNFFELLKAGMLSGSLGTYTKKSDGSPLGNRFIQTYSYDVHNAAGGRALQDPSADWQVMRVGAAIMDQADADSLPTVVDFDYAPLMTATWKSNFRTPVTGIENLPFAIGFGHYASVSQVSPGTLRNEGWLQIKLWNPHQPNTNVVRPKLQLNSGNTGDTAPVIRGSLTKSTDTYIHWTSGLRANDSQIDLTSTAGAGYASPAWLAATDSSGMSGSTADLPVNPPSGSTARRGFSLGSSSNYTDIPPSFNQYLPNYATMSASTTRNTIPIQMRYESQGIWIPFQIVPFVANSGNRQNLCKVPPPAPPANPVQYPINTSTLGSAPEIREASTFQLIDPRTTRGGVAEFPVPPANLYPGSSTLPADNDGVTRPDDIGSVAPNSSGGTAERPIVLDRAFRTPGDLGFAFRDQRWKTLNFWSDESADGGLLDIFSIRDDPRVVAGRINLNSARKEIVVALVREGVKNEAADTAFSSTEADAIADAFDKYINGDGTSANPPKPMQSRAELVNFAADSQLDGIAENNRKFEREGAIRALSSVGQTRTINLLIDLVAQSGSFSPLASRLEDFTVAGQYHVWAHVAIDRYTGEVIDFQWEPTEE